MNITKLTLSNLDAQDALASYRDAFLLPENTLYLDGNSLGPLPKVAQQRASDVVAQQWGKGLITSWNQHDWISLPSRVGNKIAKLIGANENQVVCCDSISVNIFKLLSGALAMQPTRFVIATTLDNFPTDIYMAQGLIKQLGGEYEIRYLDEENIVSQLTDDIAVLMLTEVNFRTGRKLDMHTITAAAHEKGILTLWDLAHSAGAFEVNLDKCAVDFAVGCTYKYLNGGPGAPAFIYVAQRHQVNYTQPLSGWMGHKAPFAFTPDYEPHPSVAKNLCGTPSVIAMSVLEAALSVFDKVSMRELDLKSKKLQQVFLSLMDSFELAHLLPLVSPGESERGSQLAFRHNEAYAICQAWISEGVIADFRAPDILRVGFAPLYLSFTDMQQAVEKLAAIMSTKRYLKPEFQRKLQVT
jgi:kynureninase